MYLSSIISTVSFCLIHIQIVCIHVFMCVTCILSSWNHMNYTYIYTHTYHFCNRIPSVQLLISNLSIGHVKKLRGNPDWHKMAYVHLEKSLFHSHPSSLLSLSFSLSVTHIHTHSHTHSHIHTIEEEPEVTEDRLTFSLWSALLFFTIVLVNTSYE